MNAQNNFDRALDAWFHGDATVAPPPEPLARAIESTRSIRPRVPALAWVGSSWADSDEANGLRGAITALRPAVVVAIGLLVALAAVGGALLVGSRLVPHLSKPAPFGEYRNGVIAVAKDGDIFVANQPGGDLRPLVTGPEDDASPLFSPDGTKLAFVRAIGEGRALMVGESDGTNVVQLGSKPIDDEYLTFSPDGRYLVGTGRLNDAGPYRIVIHPVDPPAEPIVLGVSLHDTSEVVFERGGPTFRPTNPQEILFTGTLEADGPGGIYVYDLATGGIRTIVEPAGLAYHARWSANGEYISYDLQSEEAGVAVATHVHVVAADGSGDRLLDATPGTVRQVSPWSNDGTRIVVARPPEGEPAYPSDFVVSTDGRGQAVELACGPSTPLECPRLWFWSPDDSTLLATSSDVVCTPPDVVDAPEDCRSVGFLQADPNSGQVTELDWDADFNDAQQWQRVAP